MSTNSLFFSENKLVEIDETAMFPKGEPRIQSNGACGRIVEIDETVDIRANREGKRKIDQALRAPHSFRKPVFSTDHPHSRLTHHHQRSIKPNTTVAGKI
ncbi:hypothetical protein CAEBREN_09461 [Caenorhabditis brenneri]|uniref:Uncharacterized protein n=1 Tax=Caenorhabditis brenneri TaxID=135651 RepID=G0NI87_CAEBE|nr:hypothetical protein CAEBREN_09461 [Caenorhabditis brenneri]